MRKYGLHSDGRQCGPIDPQRVPEQGWQWFNTGAERDAAYVPPPPPVPRSITPRQLILGALSDGWITALEAEAWAMGNSLPAVVTAVIDTLPEAQRPAARITTLRMTEAERSNPLLIAVATALNVDSAGLDDAFRTWSTI